MCVCMYACVRARRQDNVRGVQWMNVGGQLVVCFAVHTFHIRSEVLPRCLFMTRSVIDISLGMRRHAHARTQERSLIRVHTHILACASVPTRLQSVGCYYQNKPKRVSFRVSFSQSLSLLCCWCCCSFCLCC